MVTKIRMTYEDLMSQTDESVRHELVRGEILCMTPPKGRHGRVEAALGEAVGSDEYLREVPVLVAEVISPSESADYIAEKVNDYLTGGAHLVWLLFPRTRMVQVYEPERPMRVLTGEVRLEGGAVLPGFSVALSGLFI